MPTARSAGSHSLDGEPGEAVLLSQDVPQADGICLDAAGNVYVTSHRSLRVFQPDGTPWGSIAVPRPAANCAFGGQDGRTLFVAARNGIYAASMPVPGLGFAH